MNKPLFSFIILIFIFQSSVTSQSWQLWGTGPISGAFPRMTVAPNHDIFYTRQSGGGGIIPGVIYKSNTQNAVGNFVALPAIPVPPSLLNNIFSICTNQNNEPIAGILRNNGADPWLYRFNNSTQQWVTATTNANPSLGAYCMNRAPNGTIWVGGKWTYLYKSVDNGNSYTVIDQSAKMPTVYPCYFPTWGGSTLDGAIYGINIDANGRVYAGTETNGLLYSDDQGVNWKPVDFHLCKVSNPAVRDTFSPMRGASFGGNVAGIGFTSNNNVVFSGSALWSLNWPNSLAIADMTNNTVTPALGFPTSLIADGQQIPKIVTTTSGQMFLHSNGKNTDPGVGIYTSTDGIHWTLFNTGITSFMSGQASGSLAVDGNSVFMATQDGLIWKYTATPLPVQFISFTATNKGANNLLNWSISSQQNVQEYDIERSANGSSFYKIGIVQATSKNLSMQTYSYSDVSPIQGINYYRLKEVDLDGSFTYSKVVNASVGTNKLYALYPTLTNGIVTIKTETNNQLESLHIYNDVGQEINIKPAFIGTSTQYDLSLLRPGIYIFNINLNGQNFSEKVIKL